MPQTQDLTEMSNAVEDVDTAATTATEEGHVQFDDPDVAEREAVEGTAPTTKDEDSDDEDAWKDDLPAAAKKTEVAPEDDNAPQVPSHRLREQREKYEAQIRERDAELERLRGEVQATKPIDAVVAETLEKDPKIKELQDGIAAVRKLREEKKFDVLATQLGITSAEKFDEFIDSLKDELRDHKANVRATIVGERTATANAARLAAENAQNQMLQDFDTRIKSSSIPDAEKYATRVASRANQLPEQILEYLLRADDGDVATAAIGSSRKLFDELSALKSNKPLTPVQLAKAIRRIDAVGNKILERANIKRDSGDEDDPAPARAAAPTPVRTQPKPTTVRTNGTSTGRAPIRQSRDGTHVYF